MEILDGKVVSQAVKDELRQQVMLLEQQNKKTPHLAAVLIGSNGASETYVASKIKNCAEIGFRSTLVRLDENVSENDLIRTHKRESVAFCPADFATFK